MSEMAARSVRMNGLDHLIEIVTCNVSQVRDRFMPGCCDAILCNPPYRKVRSGRVNLDSQKAIARHELKGTLADFIAAAAWLLRPFGRLYVIYKAQRLIDLLAALRAGDIEPKCLRLIHSKPGMDGDSFWSRGARAAGQNCGSCHRSPFTRKTGSIPQRCEGFSTQSIFFRRRSFVMTRRRISPSSGSLIPAVQLSIALMSFWVSGMLAEASSAGEIDQLLRARSGRWRTGCS